MHPNMNLELFLEDAEEPNKLNKVHVKITDTYIFIRPDGYGLCDADDGQGEPIAFEFVEGVPRVVAWPDINNEDPEILSLHDAKESLRKD